MRDRFTGNRKRFCVDALSNQYLIQNNRRVASLIQQTGEVREYAVGEFLIKQECDSCDVFFILDGRVSIIVHGREIGLFRGKGQHVGEMAGIDASRRSACVKAVEPTTVVCLPWDTFEKLANRHPQIWKRIAAQLSARLRERSKFIRPPNAKSEVFIGSSRESLAIAQTITGAFSSELSIVAKPWTDPSIFEPSDTTIESLVKAAETADFGILVFGPDDIVISRKRKMKSPRDNVLIELGLFIGALGRKRTFFVCPRGNKLKIPSDLLGVTPLQFDLKRNQPVLSSVEEATKRLKELIVRLGPK
jgi:predicted nucleotide-binding protein